MKTIAFITRVHPKRPGMLKICVDSVRTQTDDDYIHILHRDDKTEFGYGRPQADQSFARVSSIDARYVMILDDDDMLTDPNFVKAFREIVNKRNLEIIFFKGYINAEGTLPKGRYWGQAPCRRHIASFCLAVRLDIWKKYIHEFGRKAAGDFHFISACYKNTKKHFWFDRVIAKTQKRPGDGLGEREHK